MNPNIHWLKVRHKHIEDNTIVMNKVEMSSSLFCSYCNKSYSNKSSFNRHLDSSKHIFNLKNPYHEVDKHFPKDLTNIIWKYMYPTTTSIFDQLQHGNIWGVKDLIERRKVDSIEYVWTNYPDMASREIKVRYENRDYKEIYIRAGKYSMNLDCMESEYIWKKISYMKDIAYKEFHFISQSDTEGFNILA